MLWAQSTTKDYIRAENKLQSISKLFIPQAIMPHISFSQTTAPILSTISERKLRKTITRVLEPILYSAGVSHFNVPLIVWAKSQDSVHKPQFSEEKRKESRSGSNQGPSAYQPSALPLGHTGSHTTVTDLVSLSCPGYDRSLFGRCVTHFVSDDWVGLKMAVGRRRMFVNERVGSGPLGR